MNGAPPASSPPPSSVPLPQPVHLARVLAGLALAVVVWDLCFWKIAGTGCSIAVFTATLAGVILANRGREAWTPATGVILALLAGALGATVVEPGITNALVLVILILILAGETWFREMPPHWTRWFLQVLAMVAAPARVLWLALRIFEAAGGMSAGRMFLGVFLVLPAIFLSVAFSALLGQGNAVFAHWMAWVFGSIWDHLMDFLDPVRIFFWLAIAFCLLPLLQPARRSAFWWTWAENLPRCPELLPADAAAFSSMAILVMLNLLFFIANFADAIFLWQGGTLPPGVGYSEYVHGGVNALTLAVILSGAVLTAIFQQAVSVAGRWSLKVFALLWIAQNIFLLLSVVLRLRLYIEAYDMTVLRLSVFIFLALVAAGYALLMVKIVRNKSLSWLIGGCAVAIFATFYITQFLNLAGWSADYNVVQWERDRKHPLDVQYLVDLGPAAWPAVAHAAAEGAMLPRDDNEFPQPRDPMEVVRYKEKSNPVAEFDAAHWREFSLRACLNRWALDDKK